MSARWAPDRLRGLRLHTQAVDDPGELQLLLRDWASLQPVQGWIETTDAVHDLSPGAPLPWLTGPLLSADLARVDRHTDPAHAAALRVRCAAHGWTFTTLADTEPGTPGTQPVLLREVTHIGIRGAADRLRYHLAQTLVDGSLRPVDAWFIGFGASA